jgi:hypothetical protein
MSALNVADAKTSKTCRLAGLSLQGCLAMYFREIILHVRLGHADQLICFSFSCMQSLVCKRCAIMRLRSQWEDDLLDTAECLAFRISNVVAKQMQPQPSLSKFNKNGHCAAKMTQEGQIESLPAAGFGLVISPCSFFADFSRPPSSNGVTLLCHASEMECSLLVSVKGAAVGF